MNIRAAVASDAAELVRLLHQVEDVHYAIRPDLFIQGGVKHTEEDIAHILTDPSQCIFVAEQNASETQDTAQDEAKDEAHILGYMMCKWIHEDGSRALRNMTTLFIDDICVDAQARGQGVATALYQHCVNVAREAGAQRLALNVWKGNENAKALYKHWGFSEYSTMMDMML